MDRLLAAFVGRKATWPIVVRALPSAPMLTKRVTQKSSAIALIVANVLIMRRLIVLIGYNVGEFIQILRDSLKR